MRRRMVKMIVAVVFVAIVLVGVPLGVSGALMVDENETSSLQLRASSLVRAVDRRIDEDQPVDDRMLGPWVGGTGSAAAHISVVTPDGAEHTAGPTMDDGVLRSPLTSARGATVTMEISRTGVLLRQGRVVAMVGVTSLVALAVGVWLAFRLSRRLSAPMIYLAASAEQVGSGQVRPRMAPTGIEEIDLVLAELVRTSDRMAGRLAAERQFGADASHQLRTPLAALMMRLEEIELLADSDEVREEARACLEQVERLVGVVDDLLRTSRQTAGGTTEAVHLDEVFAQLDDEWARTYAAAKRPLVFDDPGEILVLATPGALAQVLATLLENALKYGEGEVKVAARRSQNTKGVFIDVSDQGPGVADDIANDIFAKHVSTGGSTGLGLALAKDLVSADGGRLELSQRRPPVFSVYLAAVPPSLDPDTVLPPGALVTVGRRHRRR